MKALMYGAGNIGRGFIGQLFFQNGYDTTFVDVNPEIIDALNEKGEYPLQIVSNESCSNLMIKNVSGILGTDSGAVEQAIADCDVLCTAVGVNILPRIVPNLVQGIKKRSESGRELNIIICENKIDADVYLRQLIKENLPQPYHAYIDQKVGLIESSVGRMVPNVPQELKNENKLTVVAEPFCILPVNKDAWIGQPPCIDGILFESNFEYYIQSKLFLHNMGHCLTAYMGKLNGYTYIYEAIGNESIRDIVKYAMYSVAEALSLEHNRPYSEIKRYANDLIVRFGNKHLGDTIERVGRDIKRKLGINDRLLGAVRLCEKYNIDSTYIKIGVASALLFGEQYPIEDLKLEAKL